MTLSWQEEKKKKKKKMKQTLNEQVSRIKSMMNINEDDSQAILQQATQEFNEKAEEDLTPDEFQEVACVQPDSLELPTDTTNENKQKFDEFKAKVKQMVAAKDIEGLKEAKRQLKELRRKSKLQNEQAYTGPLVTLIGIQMPPAFAIGAYVFLFILILNGILSIFGIHVIRNITHWCTGRTTVGYSIRFGRD